ncbi:DNA cytosine methyltransferase [Pusillimonas noertemannii]|nr:DNA cytosine methyltransferase [Pusillimonas noertemannii]
MDTTTFIAGQVAKTGSKHRAANSKLAIERDTHPALPQVVSLFSGAGGLDWGFHQEGFHVALAIDISEAAIRTHKRNFPMTRSVAADLIQLQPVGTLELVRESVPVGARIGVIGGPPCQGFSRANTASSADDPRNELPKLYLDIVERLQQEYTVEFVVFENVLGIRDRKHAAKYKELVEGLRTLDFDVTEKELCSLDFGVPQNRRRIILSAMRDGQGYAAVRPVRKAGKKTVREAIEGLPAPKYFDRKLTAVDIPVHANHWTMRPKSLKFSNPGASFSDGRSFKRLEWDQPSPTVAYGHREIHVHPNGTRRLSIYEAMLLQGFPKSFVLEGNLSEQVEQVSNAVPPPLGKSIASAVKRALKVGKNCKADVLEN